MINVPKDTRACFAHFKMGADSIDYPCVKSAALTLRLKGLF
jgi:hypothetical protein